MKLHAFFVITSSTILWVAGGSRENMNGDYLISNPNPNSAHPGFNTRYFDRPEVEYFDVYSPPISTR